MKSTTRADNRWTHMTGILMVASIATLVQSYVGVKLLALVLFLLASLMSGLFGKACIAVHGRFVWFYVWISMAGVAWAFVGLLHQANHLQGILEALRLYVIWSAAFVVLYTLLSAGPSLRVFHNAIVMAGILIPLINFVGLYNQSSGFGFISDGIQQELDMRVGFRDGYVQLTSHNIGMMFLIAPYLLVLQFRADAGKSNSLLTKLALVLSLILVVISGRRALWLVVALTPCTILILTALTVNYSLMKSGAKRFLFGCAAAGVLGLSMLLTLPEGGLEAGTINHLRDAFSAEDERTIQRPYLIGGFLRAPLFGSGFGAYAGYTRSDERPWTYELTYYQMLYNLGIVGMTALVALFSAYFAKVMRLLRQFKDGSAIPFGLLVALCSLLAGAYSDPYLGGFDSLFFVGLLPYLSTFQLGFDRPQSTQGARSHPSAEGL